jgi:hypothetical protein
MKFAAAYPFNARLKILKLCIGLAASDGNLFIYAPLRSQKVGTDKLGCGLESIPDHDA